MKTVIIVQARMTSTRLPGKVLKEVNGKPLLAYQIERLKQVKYAQEIVVATTVNETDKPIVSLCHAMGILCFRGSEEDVLSRYYGAALEYQADIVVRVTSDCPLIDPSIIDETIQTYFQGSGRFDYVSNGLEMTYPRGMDAEVFSFKALSEAYAEAVELPEREHVTPFFYMRPERYSLKNVSCYKDYSHYRLTVDTPEDFELIRTLLEMLYPKKGLFTFDDIISTLKEHPEWSKINEHVEQKQYEQ